MPLLEVVKPARKEAPNPIIACKVSKGTQAAFDHLSEGTYNCTRLELNGFTMTCFFSTFIHALVRICFELRYGGTLGTDRTRSSSITLLVE